MAEKIKRVPFEPEEVYYIFNCLLELIYVEPSNKEHLNTLVSIAQYLGTCPCKSCRDDKAFRAWLKIIRNQSKDNYYRFTK